MFEPVVIMPVYNHGASAVRVYERVRAFGLPCIVVDDGSDAECARRLDALQARPATTLLRLPTNSGKGAAVMTGLREALRRGFTHALQIDADGQHDPAQIPAFLVLARERPDAVICGTPSDRRCRSAGGSAAMPHVWVWINAVARHSRSVRLPRLSGRSDSRDARDDAPAGAWSSSINACTGVACG
jgi:glycosyltransferase involved in cell wall biosynthesis